MNTNDLFKGAKDSIVKIEPAKNKFKVYFDGGTHWNNRDGYGSWMVEWNGFKKVASRIDFNADMVGRRITCNVAEYLALKAALKWLASVTERESYEVELWGDSMLVISQMNKHWKCKSDAMRELRRTCASLLDGFSWKAFWHKRENNVRIFGH